MKLQHDAIKSGNTFLIKSIAQKIVASILLVFCHIALGQVSPQVSLYFDPQHIVNGESTYLRLVASPADSCRESDGSSIALDQFGAANIKYDAVAEKISAQVICTNAYGSTEKSAYLSVDGSSALDSLIAESTGSEQDSLNGATQDSGFGFNSFWSTSFFDSIVAFFNDLFSSENMSQPEVEPSAFAGVIPTTYNLTVDRLGAAVYSLPVSTPNGVGGVKPNITAIYNSQSPNGLLGKGGGLGGLSAIKRCPQTFVRDGVNKAISWTAEDRFCIDTQRLMLVAGTQGEAESQYKTEIDNGVVYTAKGGTPGNPDYFEALAQDGAVLVFGGLATAKEQGAATMTWALSQYKDAANNAIEYVYEGTAADGLRIKRINYAFPEANTIDSPGAYIDFVYKDREDLIAKFVAGYEFRNTKLLTQINTYTLPGMLHRSYQFDYATSSGLAGYVSRWQGVDECVTPTQCFSASQFAWGTTQVNASGVTELKDINIGWLRDVNGTGLTSIVRADFVDLNGNGIGDLILEEQSSSTAITSTTYDPAVPAIDSDNRIRWNADQRDPAQIIQTKPFSFADINADGTLDLLTGGYVTSEYLRTYGSIQARTKNQWYLDQNQMPLYSGYRYNLYGDFDGDGLTYQLLIGREIKRYSQTRDFFINKLKRNTSTSAESLKDTARYFNYWSDNVKATFSDITTATPTERVELPTESGKPGDVDMAVADFNGDGKSDLVTYTSWHTNSANQTDYKLNWHSWNGTQFNFQGNIYTKTLSGSFYDNGNMFDATYLKDLTTPDINGDGLADISYRFLNAPVSYSLSNGNTFATPVVLNNSVITRAYKVWYHDINQDGSADFIYTAADSVSGATQYTYYVSYWSAQQSKYLDPVVLRTTLNTPIVMADANGDSWVDFVEFDQAAKTASKPYIRIYGFTNALSTTTENQGVLARDAVVGIKTGIRKFESIEYQTLTRPAVVKTKTCINPTMACQDFYGAHHYEYNRIKGVFATDSLTATEVDEKPYRRKANEPFAGLSNPYAESARVTQVINSLAIAIRTKTIVKQEADNVLLSDKKYFYGSLRTQAGGRGLLGFEKTTVEDLLAGTRTETSWRQDWPYSGLVAAQTTYTKFGKLLAEKTNQLNLTVNGGHNNKVFSPHVEQVTAKTYELKAGGAEQGNLITNLTTSAQNSSSKAIDNVVANTSSTPTLVDIGEPSEYKLNVDRLGAAVYSLPVSVPNGVGGVKPNITAVYNSQSPNGLLGKGGSLGGLSAIKRCAQTFVRDGVNKAISWTAEDRFCIDTQRLMLVAGTQGEAESQYKTEIDNGVVYTAKGGTSGNPDYFEARAQDGAVLVFGGVATAKEQGAATMTWALSQYKDAANNAIEYVYEGTAADGLRIKRINYAFPEANTIDSPGAYIDFVYKDREDLIAKFVAGYEFRNTKLLTQINTYTLPGMLHRSYQFDYATSSGLAGYVSRWQGVDECVTPTQCFSASQFAWGTTQVNASGVTELKDINIGWLGTVVKHGYTTTGYEYARLADVNNDGINDLLWIEPGTYNSTSVNFTFATYNPAVVPFDSSNISAYKVSIDPRADIGNVLPLQFADINATGTNELLYSGTLDTSYDRVRPYAHIAQRNVYYWSLDSYSLNADSGARYSLFGDLAGDGFTSQVNLNRYANKISIYPVKKVANRSPDVFNYYWPGTEIVSGLDDVKSKPSNTSVQIAYENARSGDVDLAVADFDGDGQSDLATYTSWTVPSANKTTYKLNWYSLIASNFTLRGNLYQEEKNNIYQGSDGYYYDASAVKRLEVPDINGDGLSDVALKMNNKWQYAINNGNGIAAYVSLADLTNNNPSWFFDVNQDGQIDLIRVTYDSTLKLYSYFVSYWSIKQNKFSDAELLRTTPNQVMTVGDANGDGWLDFVEYDQAAKTNNQSYIKIYGYTNSRSNAVNGYPGVLTQDAIVSVKTGLRNSVAIEYQSLIRPNRVEESICTGSYAGSQGTACQNYYGVSHYQSLRFDVQLKPGSLDAESVDTKNYYRKTNEPFAEFNNPHAGAARVTQHFGVIPIVTRVKSTSTNSSLSHQIDSDNKYFYSVLRKQAGGRGLLGFEKTTVEDLLAGTRTETSWRQDWPYTGMVRKLEEKDLQGATLREADNQLTLQVSNEASGVKVFTPSTNGQVVKNYAAPTVAGQTGRLLNAQLVGATSSSSATSSSVKSSSSVRSNASSSSVMAAPVAVELTAPGEGAVLNYELGNSIPLSAVVKAADGSIWKDTDGLPPKVVFYHYWNDSVKDETRLYQPIATGMADGMPVNWTPDSQGIYAIRAIAYLNDGTILYSKLAGIWINRPVGAPVARLMLTSYGNSYSADWTFNFAVEASDEDGIDNVSFYANDTFIGYGSSINGSTAPRLDWKPSVLGQYKIYALVKDKTGKVSKTKTMLVNYGVPSVENKIPPVIYDRYPYMSEPLSYPMDFYELGADVYLGSKITGENKSQWKEADNTIPVARFYASDVYVAESAASGYLTTWRPSLAAAYEMTAISKLKSNELVISRPATLLIAQASAPRAALTAPAYSGSSYYQGQYVPMSVTANAMSGASISKVIFYANDEEVGTDTTAPYSLSWMPPAPGMYKLKAHVVDSKGVIGVSAQREVRYLSQGTINSIVTINEPSLTALNSANDQYFDGLSSSYRLRIATQQLPENPVIEIFAKSKTAPSWSYSPWVSVEPGNASTLAAPTEVSIQSDVAGMMIFAINDEVAGSYDYRARICDRLTFNCSEFSNLASVSFSIDAGSNNSSSTQASSGTQTSNGTNASSAASSQALKLELMSPQTSFTEKYGLGAEVVLGAYLVGPGYTGGLDVNGKAAAVDFYANGVLLSGLPPYPSSKFLKGWTPTSAGRYAIHAVHRMQNGTTLVSPTGYMEFTKTGAPTISISSPVANQQLIKGQPVTISASVSDPENDVADVTFYVNNKQVGQRDETAPYTVEWTPTVSGNYTIHAVALDNTLLKSTSMAVKVVVPDITSASSANSSNSSAANGNYFGSYPANGMTIENFANAPCFQWAGGIAESSSQKILLGTTPSLKAERWIKTVTSHSACWANGSGWSSLHLANAVPEQLVEGRTYYWQVITTKNGVDFLSDIKSFVIGARGLPSIPQFTSKPIQTTGSFGLEWLPTGTVAVDYYNLKEKSNGQLNFYNNLAVRFYSLTPLNAAVYEYSLQACNTKGCSDFSEPIRVTSNPVANLASPALVVPADNSIINVSGSNPCFQWNSVAGATSYNVTINTDGHFPISRWQKIATSGTSLCWDGGFGWTAGGVQKPNEFVMQEGQTYFWRVVAVKGGNEAYGFSQTRSFQMTSGVAEVLSAPVAVTADVSASSFAISWRAVSGASYYELQKAATTDGVSIQGAEWSTSEVINGTSAIASGLSDFITYRWRVRACNQAKLCSEWRVSEPKVYQPLTTLAKATLLLPEQAAVLGGNPCFEWTPGASTTGHIVTVSTGDYFPAQRWTKSATTENRVCWNGGDGWQSAGIIKLPVPKTLQAGVPYQWRVVSGDVLGRQARSETRSFVVDANGSVNSYLPVPALTVLDADQDCFYIINFGAAANVPSSYVYELYEKKSTEQDWQLLVTRSRLRGNIPPFTLYSDADIFNGRHLSGGAYDYKARVCEGNNCGAYSHVLPVNTGTSCKNVVMPVVNFDPLIATAIVGQNNPLSVNATTSQGTITQVSFYAGGQLVGSDSSSPFSVNWRPTVEGNTHIEAIAENSLGGTASTHYKSVNVIPEPPISDTGNFNFIATQNIYGLRFDLSWKPVVGYTRFEFWKRSSGRLDELYEAAWTPGSMSQAEYNSGAMSIPVSSLPDVLYVQWKMVVCEVASGCKSQLSRVKTLNHNPKPTVTQALAPASNSVIDFNNAENNLCFNWSADPDAVAYTLAVSNIPEFPERRWQQGVSKDVTTLCWGNVNDWTRTGVYRSELPDDLAVGGTYYWRVVINYADGRQGVSNTNQFILSNGLPTLNVTSDVIAQNFKIEWNKVSSARLYQMQVRLGNSVAEVESATPRDVTLPDLLATTITESMASYKDYLMVQWQVRACQSTSNCGAWQKSRIKTNQYGAISSGISLTAPVNGSSIDVAIDQTVPCFKWNADSNATDYVVTLSDTQEFTERRWAKTVSGSTATCWDNANGWSPAGIYKDELQDGLYRGFKYYWRVVSRYSDGSLGFSQTYSFDVTDSSTPVIALLSPKPLESKRVFVGSNVPVMANVFDNYMRNWRNLDGRPPVIDYYINNALLNKGYRIPAGTPVQWLANTTGTFKFKAVAYLDDAKTLRTMEAEVTVVEPQAPTISVDTNGSASVGFAVELNAAVTDPDQQIEQITFYANGEPVGKSSSVPPYKTRWTPLVAGNYMLTAKLLDKRGNEIVSAVKNALVQPTIFSLDGLDILSDFGTPTVSQGWSVMPLKVSDVLTLKPANNYRISYNKLDKLILNRPLKIINRSDAYDNEIVPQLIVLDADQVELKSGIEIVGEPADLLIINSSASNAIRCENCGFTNVQRVMLAVATPTTVLSSSMPQVGELQTRAAGVVDINNLQASGVVSLEIIADKVIAKGHISTQQYARQSTEVNSQTGVNEQVLDFVTVPDINSVVVGSGGVSLLHGNVRVNYETMALENTVAGTGVMDLQAAISSGAINIFATDAILLSGNLSTHSSHRAAQIYRGQLRAQEEKIQLKTIVQANTAPSVRINGNVLSDAKVHVIGHSAEIAATGGVQAHSVKAELIGQLMNRGYIRGYARMTTANAANGDAMIELGAGSLDNRGEIRGVFNNLVVAGGSTSVEGKINIASKGDVYNRFGGLISAKTINVFAEGKIRNGSLFAFDATAPGGKESTTTITLAPHDSEVLSTHKELSFSLSEPPLKNTTAGILGEEVTLQAKQSVENINPYTEPYTSAAVEISTLSDNAEAHANDVQIEATRKLQIFSDTYLFNSSARLGVSQAGVNHLLSIKAPSIRNERYYSNIITEGFNDSEVVKSQTNATITTWVNGVQSRYGFYSPPGYIYSFAEAQLDFGSSGNGLLNNISFVDLYGDLKIFGQGKITTRGISLEKMAYDAGTTTVVSIDECRAAQYMGQHNAYRICAPRTTFNSTPDGKLLKLSPDNTLFAVNGQVSASMTVFNARNDQSLTVLRKKVIAEYINEQTLIAEQQHAYDISSDYMDSACIQSVSFEEKDNVLFGTRRQFSENPQVRCFHKMAFAGQNQYSQSVYSAPYNWTTSFGYKNITDLVNEKRPKMNAALNKQINDYNAWRAVAK